MTTDKQRHPVDDFVANNIRKIRQALGISQATLAQKVGMHQQTITHIERCKRFVTVGELATFAEVFSVDPAELLRPIRATAKAIVEVESLDGE
jgi:transcriptional regulator with XRE-family HTH domain